MSWTLGRGGEEAWRVGQRLVHQHAEVLLCMLPYGLRRERDHHFSRRCQTGEKKTTTTNNFLSNEMKFCIFTAPENARLYSFFQLDATSLANCGSLKIYPRLQTGLMSISYQGWFSCQLFSLSQKLFTASDYDTKVYYRANTLSASTRLMAHPTLTAWSRSAQFLPFTPCPKEPSFLSMTRLHFSQEGTLWLEATFFTAVLPWCKMTPAFPRPTCVCKLNMSFVELSKENKLYFEIG